MISINIIKYVILFFLILCWTLNPFFKKKAAINLNSEEYFIVNFILTAILAFFIWIYLVNINKNNINVFKKMKWIEIIWAFGAAFLSIIGAILLIYLIKKFEISHIMPQINPCVVVFTLLIGFYIFGEVINYNKIIGITCIILGLLFINKK